MTEVASLESVPVHFSLLYTGGLLDYCMLDVPICDFKGYCVAFIPYFFFSLLLFYFFDGKILLASNIDSDQTP